MKNTDENRIEREKMIREELHHFREVSLRVSQWGVTVLASIETVLFFQRKDIYDRLILSGAITRGQPLPFSRYVVGTAFLVLVALAFTIITLTAGKRYRFYASLLSDDAKTFLPLPPITNTGRIVLLLLYFAFPLFDVLARLWVRLEVGTH
jgi:hypothetical protein